MLILVKNLGKSGKTTEISSVCSWDKILTLKQKIGAKEGWIEPKRLFFAGKFLEDDRTLANYNIRSGSTVLCLASYSAPQGVKKKVQIDEKSEVAYFNTSLSPTRWAVHTKGTERTRQIRHPKMPTSLELRGPDEIDAVWGSRIEEMEEVVESSNPWQAMSIERAMKSDMCKAITNGDKDEVVRLITRGVHPGDFGYLDDSGSDCEILFLQRALNVCNGIYLKQADVTEPNVSSRCHDIAKLLYILTWKTVTCNGKYTHKRCPILTTARRDQLFMCGTSQMDTRINYCHELNSSTGLLFQQMFPPSAGHMKLPRNSSESVEHCAELVHPLMPNSIEDVLKMVRPRQRSHILLRGTQQSVLDAFQM